MPKSSSSWSKLLGQREEILDAWVEWQVQDPRTGAERVGRDDLARQSREILMALTDAMTAAPALEPDAPEFESVRKLLGGAALRRERAGAPGMSVAASMLSLKDYALPHLDEDVERARDFFRLVDTLGLRSYESLVERREQTIQHQALEILEISTPVIKVWDGVVAAPLIGRLDSERTQRFMERLLARIVETNSSVALVDITGVPTIDTQTAQHLIETVSAVRLLGAQVVLTGVRPTIAQTLVHLGIDLSDIATRSSFAGGVRLALELLELEVVPAAARV